MNRKSSQVPASFGLMKLKEKFEKSSNEELQITVKQARRKAFFNEDHQPKPIQPVDAVQSVTEPIRSGT